jgi:cytochrome b subunit of formate dehydrogenase
VLFLACAVTGLPLAFIDHPAAQAAYGVVGGTPGARWIHRVAGALMAAGLVYHLVYVIWTSWVKRRRGRRRPALPMLVRPRDFGDFWRTVKYLTFLSDEPPRFDRFSWRQKFDYWGALWGTAILAVTGGAMWLAALSGPVIPGAVFRAFVMIHAFDALLASAYVLVIHTYDAHLAPAKAPMAMSWLTGRISGEELVIEHNREFDELRAGHKKPELEGDELV